MCAVTINDIKKRKNRKPKKEPKALNRHHKKTSYQDILSNHRDNLVQSEYKVSTELSTSPVSSNRLLNINNRKKTNTNELDESLDLPIPENLSRIGFSKNQISKIINNPKKVLNKEDLQESLEAFSYDLEHGLIKSNRPLNLIMGVLLKHGAYTSEAMILNLQKDLDDYLKKTKEFERAKESLKKMEVQKKFEIWLQGLSKENKNKLAPPSNLITEGSRYQDVMLKNYWEKHIMESGI